MKTKNYYEEEVDIKLITEVYERTGSVEIRDALYNACQNDTKIKRLLILSILDNDRSMYKNIRTIIKKTEVYDVKHIKHVVEMLRRYVEVGEKEQKAYGEVFTPYSLINDMLDTLPDETWSNPNLKVLDPCSGVGNFSAVMVDRFMNGLVEFEPDAEKRYKHIMENMIHVCELQTKNMFLFQCAFDPMDTINLNVYNGSFLNEDFDNHAKNVWGVDKFDLIVMNPPYNDGNPNRGSAHVLWDKFVIKTINSNLVDGGYLVAVHPDGWRSLGNGFDNVKTLLKSKQMLYLELHNTNDGFNTFGAYTTYDFYCVHNVPNTMFTKIKCMDGTIQSADISKMEFIPNGMYKEFEKLIAKKGEEKVNVLRSCKYHTQKEYVSKEQTEYFKYPVVYVTYKDGTTNLRYTCTKEHGHFDIPKIIFSNGGASSPVIDEHGEYAITEFSYGIIDTPENLSYIKNAMLNPEFLKLMSFSDGTTGVGRHRYNYKAIALFRKDFWKEFID